MSEYVDIQYIVQYAHGVAQVGELVLPVDGIYLNNHGTTTEYYVAMKYANVQYLISEETYRVLKAKLIPAKGGRVHNRV